MILYGENRQVTVGQPFDGLVIQIEMRYFCRPFQRVGIHGEAMVLRGNLHFAGSPIDHGLVAAVMAELEFVGVAS